MDSKGGSLQTSSGGDDEYSSRAAYSISAFFNQQRPPPSHHRRSDASNSSMFDPLSPYLDPLPPAPSTLNPEAVFASGSTFFGSTAAESTIPRAAATDDETHRVRNPRKRSRASRRTPTTVLTTDTANFRAMVQEFTGIPAPPFFAGPSAMGSGPLGAPQTPNYLLRPFAQKLQPPPPVVSSFPFPSSSMTNQALTLQSLLQPSIDPHLKIGVLDGFEFRHGLPNLVSSDGTTNTSCPTGSATGEASNNAADHTHHLSNSMHANYDYSQSISNGKFKNLHAPAQGTNMIEPWLCSSD